MAKHPLVCGRRHKRRSKLMASSRCKILNNVTCVGRNRRRAIRSNRSIPNVNARPQLDLVRRDRKTRPFQFERVLLSAKGDMPHRDVIYSLAIRDEFIIRFQIDYLLIKEHENLTALRCWRAATATKRISAEDRLVNCRCKWDSCTVKIETHIRGHVIYLDACM